LLKTKERRKGSSFNRKDVSYVSFVAKEGRPTLSFVSFSVVTTFSAFFEDSVMNVY
jgi:hypothetical protein